MKRVAVLGSTGSIGCQTLNVIRSHPQEFEVVGLTCGKNYQRFNEQIAEFHPQLVYVDDAIAREKVRLSGAKHLPSATEVAAMDCDIVVTGQVGVSGVEPCIAAIQAGHDIALANKETLACCGDLIMRLARQNNVQILPVDSEHSAIWQCLKSGKQEEIKRLILTASGGAFRGKSREELQGVNYKDALKHPTWNMGVKVTIDSASLMNKGLEIIEAMHLFGIESQKIDVIIHKESIIHSMVEYLDNSTIAQLSYPSMELPIQLALSYPSRIPSNVASLDFAKLSNLTFEEPDTEVFRCLDIAKECARLGGLYPCAMNASNEIAVDAFIKGKISFLDIADNIERTLSVMNIPHEYDYNTAKDIDMQARKAISTIIDSI